MQVDLEAIGDCCYNARVSRLVRTTFAVEAAALGVNELARVLRECLPRPPQI